MTNIEAIETLRANYPDACYEQLREAVDTAIEALKSQGAAGDTISRKAAIDSLYHVDEYNRRSIDAIRNLPSAVRHGWWEHLGGDEWCCTACGHVISTEGSWERPWQKYCEECGAKMDGDIE